jgi:hypothetical protein
MAQPTSIEIDWGSPIPTTIGDKVVGMSTHDVYVGGMKIAKVRSFEALATLEGVVYYLDERGDEHQLAGTIEVRPKERGEARLSRA